MRKPVVSLLVGVFVAMVLLLAPGRSPAIVLATVNLTDNWGFVYAQGTTTFGECTVGLLQTGTVLSSTTPMECKVNGSLAAADGVVTGTVSGLTVNAQVAFTWPSAFTVYVVGTASGDGSTQQGNWDYTPTPPPPTTLT